LLPDISTSMYIYVNDCGRGLCSSICSVFYLPILQDANHFVMGTPEKFKFMTKHQEIFWYKIKCAFFPTSCVHSTNIHPTNFLSNNFVLLTSLSEKYFIENTRAYPTRHSMIFFPGFLFLSLSTMHL